MIVTYQVEVDEREANITAKEIADIGLNALSDAFRILGCYFDVGYNPNMILPGGRRS